VGANNPTSNFQHPISTPQTLPQYLLDAAARFPANQVALRKKTLGIWREYTWREYVAQVRDFCLGLIALGLQRGDKVAIIGENDPEYYWAELAIQAAGAVAVGVFTDSTSPEIQYVVAHADATFVLAKDQEQCDKLIAAREQLPLVKKIIFWEERGLWNYNDDWLMDFRDAQNLGRDLHARAPEKFDQMVAQGKRDDLAVFCYTSGTTGQPKGAMIAHRNLIAAYTNTATADERRRTDEYLSFLPMAWITEHALGLAGHLIAGNVVSFPEEPETVQQNLREISPHTLLFSSRLWENIVSTIQVRINDTSRVNRLLYNLFLPIGYRVADLKFAKKAVPFYLSALNAMGETAVFHPLRDKFGLQRMRLAYTSGAALSPDMLRFCRAIGLNLKQLYGSTEAEIHTFHRDDDVKFESVGKPAPNVQIKISAEGEILVKSDSVFVGYHKNPKTTEEKLADGWFHTGDAGYIDDDGHLIYLDRLVDLLALASGEKYSPQYLEGRLKFSPYIKDMMAIGNQRPYVTAIINIDFENVGRWAERKGIGYTTFVDLSQKPETYDLIRADVERVNKSLPPAARVRKFVLLHKEFDPDEGDLTRTRKLKRGNLEARYQEMIEAMYSGLDQVRVRADVKYRDGRTGVIETAVRVAEVK
jgi:long-chain acyl-CoA synthetase